MPTFIESAGVYADGVEALFAPPAVATGTRGGTGPISHDDLATQAESLAQRSQELTAAAAEQLETGDPDAHAQTSLALLAKLVTDLEVSSVLLRAAQDEQSRQAFDVPRAASRGASSRNAVADELQILRNGGDVSTVTKTLLRGTTAPADLPAARAQLKQTTGDVLQLLSERAGKTGQTALTRLLGLSAGELAKAAGMVTMDVAASLGQASLLTRLYTAFRSFFTQAWDTLLTLVGKQLAETVSKQAAEWVAKLKSGDLRDKLVEAYYQTKTTKTDLDAKIEASPADLAHFVVAIKDVNDLSLNFGHQMDIADKVLTGLQWIAYVPAAALPQVQLLFAGAYLLLGGYAILAGADFVDAPNSLLKRIPGIPTTISQDLSLSTA